jgi:hypothetical protein
MAKKRKAQKTKIKRKRMKKKNKSNRQPNSDAEALEPAEAYVPTIPT